MPLPRKKTTTRAKAATTTPKGKKATSTPRGRAKPGERLLLTCHPLIGEGSMQIIAESMFGMMLYDDLGRYIQVVGTRIDGDAHKIYGRFQHMYEAAPYMFAPV